MLTCPDCNQMIEKHVNHCSNCNWKLEMLDGFPVFLSTRDASDVMFKRYLDNYNEISVDDLRSSIQSEKYLKSQNDKLFTYLPDLSNLNVCEVGIGKGVLLERLMKANVARLTGIDISLPYMNAIREQYGDKVELVIANAENIPYKEEFDIIIAADIIEHVFNVGDFLVSVNRALKPGGRFIVKTPLNEDINTYSKLKGCKYEFVHLRNFNKKTLSILLKGAGYALNNFHYDGFYPYKRRNYIRNSSFLNKKFENFVARKFADDNEVNNIGNFWGKLMMNPIEITAVTTKICDVL